MCIRDSNEAGLMENSYSENVNEPNPSLEIETTQATSVSENHNIEHHETNTTESSNGLENFGLQEEESFGLFDNNNETQNTLAEEEKNNEEDELEIPAFLRRQKN